MVTLQAAADAGYATLREQYAKADFSRNLWFAGNTLHTLMDHLVVSSRIDDDGLLQSALDIFDRLDGPGWWRDDFGWWGNAFVFATDHRKALGYGDKSHDAFFEKIAARTVTCFQKLAENWSDEEPYDCDNDHATRNTEITGGVANLWDPRQFMAGRNSVTNEGFLLLAHGLARTQPAVRDKAGRDVARLRDASAAWFKRWIDMGIDAANPGLLNADGLILERPTGNAKAADWYWSGDQGLFAHAYAVSHPNSDRPAEVIANVMKEMTDDSGVLHENLKGFERGSPLNAFLSDYATGKGVFMRHLAPFIAAGTVADLSDFILRNADAVWTSQTDGHQFAFNWNPAADGYEPQDASPEKEALNSLIFQTAGQAALVAALRVGPADREMPPSG